MPEPGLATMPDSPLRDALHYWERHRIPYNFALVALCAAWVVLTWPHFRPAANVPDLGRLFVLALLANVCYSSAYLIDLPMQHSAGRDAWRRNRWKLWALGTLSALLVAQYWIGDEIYPFVGPR